MQKHLSSIPDHDRPYERAERYGAQVLSDAELIAVILRSGTKNMDVLDIASSLTEISSYDGLGFLLHVAMEDLLQIPGIGRVKAIQLLCVAELCKRLWKCKVARASDCMSDPAQCAAYYLQDMRHLEREQLRAVFLDVKGRLIKDVIMTTGTVNASLACVRDILIEALRSRAVGLILIHNHPSGQCSPSKEDEAVTGKIRRGCEAVDIHFVDHVIIAGNDYYSFKERGFLDG